MSIKHVCEKNSPEWLILRTGKPTASEFSRILTPEGKPSKQAEAYMHSILAELMVGHPITGPETEWMQRGRELEDSAVAAWEFAGGIETEPGNFWTTDDETVGATPDRLIGADGILEIKIPKESTQIKYLLTGSTESEYRCQLQGQLWVCDRNYVDIVSHHPEMPEAIVKVQRDERFISLLKAAVGAFVETLQQARFALEQKFGKFPDMELRLPTPRDEAAPTPAGSYPIPGVPGMTITDSDLDRMIAAQRSGRDVF